MSVTTPFLISLNEVCSLTSLSRTAINNFRRRAEFPEEVNMGERRVAFVRTEVFEWIQSRIDARARGRNSKSSANDNVTTEVRAAA